MLNRRSTVGLLVMVNLMLLTALLVVSYPPKLAIAQAGRGSGQFITVTAKAAGQTYDVYYLLDTTARKLYGVYPSNARRGKLQTSQPRDLAADFNRP